MACHVKSLKRTTQTSSGLPKALPVRPGQSPPTNQLARPWADSLRVELRGLAGVAPRLSTGSWRTPSAALRSSRPAPGSASSDVHPRLRSIT